MKSVMLSVKWKQSSEKIEKLSGCVCELFPMILFVVGGLAFHEKLF
jgi:hypothetical protein